ncbi:MAG TPA: ABC transporter permease, partial [Flavisolibacter sp.]
VLAAVDSLEKNIRREIRSLGTNTIYIDKWQYNSRPGASYWKFATRPAPRFPEMQALLSRVPTIKYAAFKIESRFPVQAFSSTASNVRVYGISSEFPMIQPLDIQFGRQLTAADHERGTASIIIGFELAQMIFPQPASAVGKTVGIRGRQHTVAGVLKKQGNQLIGGWGFDKSIIMTYTHARSMMDETKADPFIMVQGHEGIPGSEVAAETRTALRAIRKLRPLEEDNFSLNDVNDFSKTLGDAFRGVNLGGWAIGALAFIVGIFGVANIMFVTVRERTSQIGLKMAVGAQRSHILAEVLLESVFLCLLGGIAGLLMVAILVPVAATLAEFPVFLSPGLIATGLLISTIAGVAAGMIPAYQAARLDPVTAIRSN